VRPPTVHRGPDPSSPRRLKSAFQGAMRRASAFADAKDNPPVGAGRPRPKAFVPIEIGLPRRCTPSVGLRRRKRHLPRSAQADRRPKASPRPNSFGMQADRRPKASVPIKIGLPRRCTPSVGLRRRKRRSSVGAGRPLAEEASPGRIHSACRPSGRNCPRLTKSGHIDKDGYRSFPDPLSSS
jgi:hypothetical protein